MKKKWIKPNLIVLMRGKNEEKILMICKNGGAAGPVDSAGGVLRSRVSAV